MSSDVNEAFATERAAQLQAARERKADRDRRIASGQLIPLGEGRYRVNDPDSLDNGETLYLRHGVLLPQHGLDTTTGEAALYTAAPAWHGLGNVVPGGTTDIDRVLELGNIDYRVETVPAQYMWDGELRTHEDRFHTVRTDTGASLGVVGRFYHVVQNREAFEFLQDLVNDFHVTWESAGALREGKKVFVSMRLPENVTIDAEGINDELVPYVSAINTHDGCSPFTCVVSPWRPVCGNTERFAVRDALTKWTIRHTKSATQRFEEARRTLRLSISYFEQFAEEENALARTDLAIDAFRQLVSELWPVEDDAGDRAKRSADARREQITGLFERESGRTGRTAYAGERALTEYLDHFGGVRPSSAMEPNRLDARALRLMEGTDDALKSEAHRRLMLLRRR
ncbi:DUF932 domain-containing protein [Streptomyces rimosus]|uniref:DUF932 domain-containing protein n=1 Tax=Streptomyces rimosus TaxID=1927 RepID=UPI0031CEEBB3